MPHYQMKTTMMMMMFQCGDDKCVRQCGEPEVTAGASWHPAHSFIARLSYWCYYEGFGNPEHAVNSSVLNVDLAKTT